MCQNCDKIEKNKNNSQKDIVSLPYLIYMILLFNWICQEKRKDIYGFAEYF